jgi:threonine dehydrogenase-like Zn-dependent dehydrogenase
MINRQNHCRKWGAVGVTRDGGFAEYVKVPARNCYAFEKVSFAEGAFTEPLACVVFGQDRARIDIGSDVLILGAGPIGQLQLQASRANGAATVTVVDSVESKLDMARKYGATHTVIADNAMGEKLRKIRDVGFDVVIDATGNPKAIQDGIQYIKNGGRFLLFGVCSPDAKIEISPFEIYRRDLEIIGSFAIRRTYDRAFKLMENGVIDVKGLIHTVLPLEEIAHGLDLMRKGQAGMKLQVQFGG